MKPETCDPLLDAVLDPDAAFRRDMLAQTVSLARRRRRNRLADRVFAVTSVLAVLAFLFRPRIPVPEPRPIAEIPALRVVRSMPLAANESVRTSAALFDRFSSAPSGLTVFTSDSHNLVRIETRTSVPMLDYLSDEQLLAAFPVQHPALIAPGTGEARLIFY